MPMNVSRRKFISGVAAIAVVGPSLKATPEWVAPMFRFDEQMTVNTASEVWLDRLAQVWCASRNLGEDDEAFRRRLVQLACNSGIER